MRRVLRVAALTSSMFIAVASGPDKILLPTIPLPTVAYLQRFVPSINYEPTEDGHYGHYKIPFTQEPCYSLTHGWRD